MYVKYAHMRPEPCLFCIRKQKNNTYPAQLATILMEHNLLSV